MSSLEKTDDPCLQGKLALQARKFDDAIHIFQQLIDQDPDDIAPHEGLANTYFAQKNYASAVPVYEKITRLDPKQTKALINLGAAYNCMKKHTEAIAVLRRAIQKDRSSTHAYYNMGLAHRGLGQNSMAISAYREVIRHDQTFIHAHQNLANLFAEMKNFQQAIAHYEKALEINPQFSRAVTGLNTVREKMQEEQQSRNPFGRLVDLDAAHNQQQSPEKIRDMTTEERQKDRFTIATMTSSTEQAATRFLDDLRGKIDPDLQAIDRVISSLQNNQLSTTIFDVHKQFKASIQRNSACYRTLKAQAKNLKDHLDANC